MPAGTSEKTNLGWQFEQLQRRWGEWWELQTLQLGDRVPQIPGLGWLDPDALKAIADILFWAILIFIITWIALAIIRVFRLYFHQFQSAQNIDLNSQSRPDLAKLSSDAWRSRSHKFQQQGNYREACFCLYQAMLQQLNDREIIANEFSRTDGEYLRLTKYLPQASYYQTILRIHQQLCFSETEANSDTFQRCQQADREIAK